MGTLSRCISDKGVPAHKVTLEDAVTSILAVWAPGYASRLTDDMNACAQGPYEGALPLLLRYHSYRKALKLPLDPRDSLMRLRYVGNEDTHAHAHEVCWQRRRHGQRAHACGGRHARRAG